ncbi:MAG: SDR family oxidoreductase [Verrucomicrobia bacterium]|nr:SDR family oxidoreductase [Verrucomicrobiota bacterium]
MLEQKVAFVTGAARGIGASISHQFAAAGYAVAMIDKMAENLQKTAQAVSEKNPSVYPIAADLSDLGSAKAAVEKVGKKWGRIDALVNNAAIHDFRTIRKMTSESWDRIMHLNLKIPAFLAQYATPLLEASKAGVIINIASIDAHFCKGVAPAYVASKGGLISLTFDMAASLSGAGIRAVAVSPGAVDSALRSNLTSEKGSDLTNDFRAASEDYIPLGRWASPDEVAKVVCWLASSDASYINGTEIEVDGGISHNNLSNTLKKRMYPDEFR